MELTLKVVAAIAVFYGMFFLINFIDDNWNWKWYSFPTSMLIIFGGILFISLIAR